MIYADDLETGIAYEAGTATVSADEIIAFATQWDPQPFHIDLAVAEAGYFGGLIGSGIHSFAIFQRLAVQGVYRDWAIIAGRAVRDITFPNPLRPGSTVRASVTLTAIERTSERRSLVFKHGTLTDQTGAIVFDMHAEAYMRNRPPALNGRVDSVGVSA